MCDCKEESNGAENIKTGGKGADTNHDRNNSECEKRPSSEQELRFCLE